MSDEVLHPFGARFRPDAPFRPVTIRGIHADGTAFFDSIAFDELGETVSPDGAAGR